MTSVGTIGTQGVTNHWLESRWRFENSSFLDIDRTIKCHLGSYLINHIVYENTCKFVHVLRDFKVETEEIFFICWMGGVGRVMLFSFFYNGSQMASTCLTMKLLECL